MRELKGSRMAGSLMVFFAFLLVLAPISSADEGAVTSSTAGSSGNWWSKMKNSFSNIGMPNIFSELSPADVGVKPKVKPHFAFTQGFNSNANLGGKQADAAWQARIAPGISVSIPSGKLYTEMDYTYAFVTTQGRKTNANTNAHNLNALARYELSEDTIIGISNNLQNSQLPGQTDKTFWLDTATAQASHRLSPKLVGTLSDTFQWYKDSTKPTATRAPSPIRDKEFKNTFVDNGVGANLDYDALEDLTVGPSFKWNIRHYKDSEGKSYWQILPAANASYKLGPKTTLAGNFGWAYRRFDKKVDTTSGTHESELVYGVGANHLLGQKLVWGINYAKTLQDTFDTNFIFRDRPEASPTELDDLDRQFRVLKSHRISTSATYRFTERHSVDSFFDTSFVNGDATDNVIVHQKSHEKTMQVGAGYTYRLNSYIALDIHYVFGRRFTAEGDHTVGDRNEYTFHKVTGGVNITV